MLAKNKQLEMTPITPHNRINLIDDVCGTVNKYDPSIIYYFFYQLE